MAGGIPHPLRGRSAPAEGVRTVGTGGTLRESELLRNLFTRSKTPFFGVFGLFGGILHPAGVRAEMGRIRTPARVFAWGDTGGGYLSRVWRWGVGGSVGCTVSAGGVCMRWGGVCVYGLPPSPSMVIGQRIRRRRGAGFSDAGRVRCGGGRGAGLRWYRWGWSPLLCYQRRRRGQPCRWSAGGGGFGSGSVGGGLPCYRWRGAVGVSPAMGSGCVSRYNCIGVFVYT